jgi:hypothetical protein
VTPKELAAIKALLRGSHGTHGWYPLGEAQLLALVTKVEQLQQALESYDRHSEGCGGQYGPSYRCRCGWRDEARALGVGVDEEGDA